MALQAGGVRRHLVEDQRAERDMLLGVERIARTALEDMHRMLHLLRADDAGGDTDLIPQPGLSGLDELLRDARTSGLDVVLRCSGDVRDVPAAVGLTAYRIVQESLTNVRKHSDARRADVCIDSDGRRIRICISDDGTALPGRAAGAGLGLLGMRERVAVHGGELTAAAKEDGPGFLVQATLPVHADADAS
jgi:signal transduction histidine kinase